MANRFLGSGDETQNHLLAGFDTLTDESDAGRGSAGFGSLPLLESVWRAVVATKASIYKLPPSNPPARPAIYREHETLSP